METVISVIQTALPVFLALALGMLCRQKKFLTREGIDALKKAVKDGMPEDVQKDGEEKLQKLHDKYVKKVEDLYADKEKEIMTV